MTSPSRSISLFREWTKVSLVEDRPGLFHQRMRNLNMRWRIRVGLSGSCLSRLSKRSVGLQLDRLSYALSLQFLRIRKKGVRKFSPEAEQVEPTSLMKESSFSFWSSPRAAQSFFKVIPGRTGCRISLSRGLSSSFFWEFRHFNVLDLLY